MTYGTGRSMTFKDHPEIKQIAENSAQTGFGLRDMIIAVVQSETFGKK